MNQAELREVKGLITRRFNKLLKDAGELCSKDWKQAFAAHKKATKTERLAFETAQKLLDEKFEKLGYSSHRYRSRDVSQSFVREHYCKYPEFYVVQPRILSACDELIDEIILGTLTDMDISKALAKIPTSAEAFLKK